MDEVRGALDDEIQRILADGPTEEEVERSKNQWRKSFYQRLESVAGKSRMLQSYNHHTGRPDYVAQDLKRYVDVTVQSVSEWARKVMNPEHRLELIVRPVEPGGEVSGQGEATP